jgi:molybdopterin converting factor small subunit
MAEVKLLAGLRARVGAGSLRVDVGDVRELLSVLAERGGPALSEALYADPARGARPEASRDLRVLVNGRSIAFLQGLDTPLGAEDRVTVHLAGARGHPGG